MTPRKHATLPLVSYLNEDALRTVDAARMIVAATPHRRHGLIMRHPEWRGLHTFRGLLEAAHDALDREPRSSRELTVLVLWELRSYHAPDELALLATQLRGNAWKDHANALRACGKILPALRSADRAIRILAPHHALIVDHAAAQMIRAHLFHELGHTREALATLEACAHVFAVQHEAHRQLQALVFIAIILYHEGAFERTYALLMNAQDLAVSLDDQRELARIHNNAGHAALALGRDADAWTHFVQAAALFSAQRMDAELPRVAWGIARLVRNDTSPARAITYYERLYASFAERDMRVDAAIVLLDLAAVLARNASPEIGSVCRHITTVLLRAGLEEQAHRAVAYLQAQLAKGAAAPLHDDITYVRQYFARLRHNPTAVFATPGH